MVQVQIGVYYMGCTLVPAANTTELSVSGGDVAFVKLL